ncbi:hypothetical protein F9499_24140 [Escherichia coli]|nr:hypothetical protein [Escherichia coli]
MIVKFHARGKGGGSGPVDYLLGRERNREGATVLRGNPEEIRELIDATPFSKKYTSGVLSFAEKELPPGERERVMTSFERVLIAYSALFDHGLASKSDQRFASIRSTGNLTFSTAF